MPALLGQDVLAVSPKTPTAGCCCQSTATMAATSSSDELAAGAVSPAPAPVSTAAPVPTALPSAKPMGEWSDQFPLANVPIHTHLLHTGKVLFWGRRQDPTGTTFESLNEWETHSFLFDPGTLTCVATGNQPRAARNDPNPGSSDPGISAPARSASGQSINLFCSSHTFLPDGRLFVTGGHLFDSQGIDSATIYDPAKDRWLPADPMQGQTKLDPATSHWTNGRWYPTAITLADGAVFVCSGTFAGTEPEPAPNNPKTTPNNDTPEIWDNAPWEQLTPFQQATGFEMSLFPRFHLAPDGRVFMSGPGAESFFFDAAGTGTWEAADTRNAGLRDYAPSVLYDAGKILFIGGGNDPDTHLPSQIVEKIDLTQPIPLWTPAASMAFRRRQHNATLLADGTILVTGGSKGGGGAGGQGFNDLSASVRTPELWDPASDLWTEMADEQTDRCYHSTAILLPDGRVLSAGGGEYQPDSTLQPNGAADSHPNAQIFCPPYLFRGPRPEFADAPKEITYGEIFRVTTTNKVEIARATLLGMSSVTHSFNTTQRINFLTIESSGREITLTAPPDANVCPPGFHMLFLLSSDGTPSEAKILRVMGEPDPPHRASVAVVDQRLRNATLKANSPRPEVVIGLTPVCPYGLGTCWGGAYRALKMLDGVETVLDPDSSAAVATLLLNHDGLPDLNAWPLQFASLANGSYTWRGVEMTLSGPVVERAGILVLSATESRAEVTLLPLQRNDKVQLDETNGVLNPLPLDEENAWAELTNGVREQADNVSFAITGPIFEVETGKYILEVRRAHLEIN